MLIGSFLQAQRRLLTLSFAVVALFSACSGETPKTASVGFEGGAPRQFGAPCEGDQSQPCSITLSQHNGVLECYHGTQKCEGGRWGACTSGTITEQAALSPPQGLRPMALSDPDGCESNPCNPFCRWFDEVPNPPLSGIDENSTWYHWDSGSLADLPGAVVDQALDEPCETGADCQFNTRCDNPSLGTCAHSVCESGIALTQTCNECAALVAGLAADDPSGYGGCFEDFKDPTAEQCAHDPCATGVALKTTCNAGVADVCADAAFATCCTNAWDATCAERYRQQNPGVCQCGPGEVARDEGCLFYVPAELSWTSARDTCRNHGQGWDLAWVEDAAENAFIQDTWTGPESQPWLGLNDRELEGTWTWSSSQLPGSWQESTASGFYVNWCGPNGAGAPACPDGATEPLAGTGYNCATMNTAGAWRAVSCSNTKSSSVCKGPPLLSGEPDGDSCVSGGEYVVNWGLFEPNATGVQEHYFETGDYVISIVAAGEYAGSIWPIMEVSIDEQVVSTISVSRADWKSYSFDYTVTTAGTKSISVRFTNDFFDSTTGQDRNLFVNAIAVNCADSPPPTPTWGEECVGAAETVCAVDCDADHTATGVCTPWMPGETDASCPDLPDLSLGVPCSGSVPVCNHGQQPADAGVTVVHLPASAGQFGSASPDLDGGDVVRCVTKEPVPPGECISLTEADCDGPLSGTRDVIVNPPGDDAIIECSGLDNWATSVDSVECGEPACFGGSTSVTTVRRPVDIIFVIDNSGSMQEEIAAVQQRINEDFAGIIEDSGLDYRVIMVSRYGDVDQPFGSSGGTSYPICIGPPLGGNACTNPNSEVPDPTPRFFHYSAAVGSNDALCLLIDGFSSPDELGVTNRPGWKVQAPSGFGAWLRPDAFKTFVVITDDNVQCTTSGGESFDDLESPTGGVTVATNFDAALRTLSPSQFQDANGERDYIWHSIVNVPENTPADAPWPPDDPITTTLCSGPPGNYVGPGTGYQALSKLTGGLRYPSCRTSDFDAVFNAIAAEVINKSELTCMFEINGDGIDLNAAHVSYTASNDDKVSIDEVADAGACDSGGWYLDQPADGPPVVSLCPSTCQEVQDDPGAQLFVEFGCEVSLTTTTRTEVYEADCEQGTIIEWKALGYDTSIDGEGSVQFRVRTAVTADELADAAYKTVNTATESNPDCPYLEPMVCVDADTDCNCVTATGQTQGVGGGVILGGEVLDAVSSRQQFLELEITVVPDLDGMTTPVVEAWKVAYSCLPGE